MFPDRGPVNRESVPHVWEETARGGDREGRVTPRSFSSSLEDTDPVGTSVLHLLMTNWWCVSLPLSLLMHPHEPVGGIARVPSWSIHE
jgi:hypothetical protein